MKVFMPALPESRIWHMQRIVDPDQSGIVDLEEWTQFVTDGERRFSDSLGTALAQKSDEDLVDMLLKGAEGADGKEAADLLKARFVDLHSSVNTLAQQAPGSPSGSPSRSASDISQLQKL